jgi:hypothetical protein
MPSTSLALSLEQLQAEARALIKEHNNRFHCTGLILTPHNDLYSVLAENWPDNIDARRALHEMNSSLARAGFRGFSIAPESGALIMRFDCRR